MGRNPSELERLVEGPSPEQALYGHVGEVSRVELTPEEQKEVDAFRASLVTRRVKKDAKRTCECCNAFLAGGGVCEKCQKESAVCPYCGDKSSPEVCRACINAGAAWCRLCRGVRGPEDAECKKCREAAGRLSADQFRETPVTGTVGIPEGSHVYVPTTVSQAMSGPATIRPDIPGV